MNIKLVYTFTFDGKISSFDQSLNGDIQFSCWCETFGPPCTFCRADFSLQEYMFHRYYHVESHWQKHFFSKPTYFCLAKIIRPPAVFWLFLHETNVSLARKLHTRVEELFLNIFNKKNLKNNLYLNL